jgi:hypothetical protein
MKKVSSVNRIVEEGKERMDEDYKSLPSLTSEHDHIADYFKTNDS